MIKEVLLPVGRRKSRVCQRGLPKRRCVYFLGDAAPLVQGISIEAHHLLAVYDWPGNVRELENAIRRAIALGTSPYIQPEDLPEELRSHAAAEGELGT